MKNKKKNPVQFATRTVIMKSNGDTVVTTPWNSQGNTPFRIDIGCGPNKRAGFYGVDCISFPNVDQVVDLRNQWPWPDNSVDEAHSSHVIEHFTALERVHFINELYRVLKVGAKATLIAPHWSSCRAYGDPTHQWPPISEFLFYYWKREWRKTQAPHTDIDHLPTGFTCNFEVTWGYQFDGNTATRNQEYQQFAMAHYKDVCQDVIATCTKLP